jgi:predicted alpha/beta-hydrolase family hydrolase
MVPGPNVPVDGGWVSTHFYVPDGAGPLAFLFAHGAGATQASPAIVDGAMALARRNVSVATFNFPYTEAKRKFPDPGPVLEATYRAVLTTLRSTTEFGDAVLFAGGRSMGGRIASQVAAVDPLGLRGLVLLGYPLHPPGKPAQLRVSHFPKVALPALFVQGTRDPFGGPDELAPHVASLAGPVAVHAVSGGDHSFVVKKADRPGSQADVMNGIWDVVAGWMARV